MSEQSLNYAVEHSSSVQPEETAGRRPVCLPGLPEETLPQGEVAPGQVAQAGEGEVSTL